MLRAIHLILLLLNLSFGVERLFYLMGTYAYIDLTSEEKVYEAYKYMKELEGKLSDYIEDSEISLINKNAGLRAVEVSEETLEVIKISLKVAEKTYGYFDISVGAITINCKRKKIIDCDRAEKLVDYRNIEISDNRVFLKKRGMAIDLGGIGKGYAVEKAYEKVRTERGFIGIAGDMKVWGEKRLLAVKDPLRKGVLAQMVNKRDVCLSTSGNYIRKHIKQGDKDLVQITVAYKNCTYADAYATALFAMPKGKRERFLRENPDVGVLELYKNGTIRMNKAFRNFFEIILLR